MTDRKEQVAEIIRDARHRASRSVRYTPAPEPPSQYDREAAARIHALYAQQGEPVAWLVEADFGDGFEPHSASFYPRGYTPRRGPLFYSRYEAEAHAAAWRDRTKDIRVTPLVPAGPQEGEERLVIPRDAVTYGRDRVECGDAVIVRDEWWCPEHGVALVPPDPPGSGWYCPVGEAQEPQPEGERAARIVGNADKSGDKTWADSVTAAPPEGGLVEEIRNRIRITEHGAAVQAYNAGWGASEWEAFLPTETLEELRLLRSAAAEIEALRARVGEP
jgi:hypothetical protein